MSLCDVNYMEYGFEPASERSLVRTIVADGFKYYSDARKLFIPAMRGSKILNVHYSTIRIYGGGPQICTYGDYIQKITILDFILRYQLCKVVSDRYKGNKFRMNELSIEFIEELLDGNGPADDRFGEKIIIDMAFQNHVLGVLTVFI